MRGALGQRCYDATVHGMEVHGGLTPMALCRDALLMAAGAIHAFNRIALDNAPHRRGTVGWADVHPNSRDLILDRVKFRVDVRAVDDASLTAMDHALHAPCNVRASGRQVGQHPSQYRGQQLHQRRTPRRGLSRVRRALRDHLRFVTDSRSVISGPT
uniref:Peptidase M20 dimerisation domain-containing protein n=1 Tax=Paraburkholderia sprentiae WSM5005 TaxID=754502 RepID=A0A1I9YNA9_9BURK